MKKKPMAIGTKVRCPTEVGIKLTEPKPNYAALVDYAGTAIHLNWGNNYIILMHIPQFIIHRDNQQDVGYTM